jgi:hypothetical protein
MVTAHLSAQLVRGLEHALALVEPRVVPAQHSVVVEARGVLEPEWPLRNGWSTLPAGNSSADAS